MEESCLGMINGPSKAVPVFHGTPWENKVPCRLNSLLLAHWWVKWTQKREVFKPKPPPPPPPPPIILRHLQGYLGYDPEGWPLWLDSTISNFYSTCNLKSFHPAKSKNEMLTSTALYEYISSSIYKMRSVYTFKYAFQTVTQ